MSTVLLEGFYPAITWLATYAVHSSVLLCGAWILTRLFVQENPAGRDLIWKTAVIGSIATATFAVVALPNALPAMLSSAIQEGLDAGANRDAGIGIERSVDTAVDTGSDGSPVFGSTAAHLTSPAATDVPTAEATPSIVLGQRTVIGIVFAWMALAGVLLFRLARRRAGFFRQIGRRRPVLAGAMYTELQRLSEAHEEDAVALTTAPRLASPAVLTAREICVPTEAFSRLDEAEQRSLVGHEFAHVVRRDPTWLRVFHVIERLLFFQPMNRVARVEFENAAEELCDSWVVDSTGDSESLASCLVRVARWMTAEPEVGFASIAGGALRSRIERLMSGQARTHSMHPLAMLASGILVMGIAAWGPRVAIDGPAASTEARAYMPTYPDANSIGVGAAALAQFAGHPIADTVVVRFGSDVRYEFANAGERTTLTGRGTVVLHRRGSVSRISSGGHMRLETDADGVVKVLIARPSSPGSIAYEYEENGSSRPFSERAQNWLTDSIRRFVEHQSELRSLESDLAQMESNREAVLKDRDELRARLLNRELELRQQAEVLNDLDLRRDLELQQEHLALARRLQSQVADDARLQDLKSSEAARKLLMSREVALVDAQNALESLRSRLESDELQLRQNDQAQYERLRSAYALREEQARLQSDLNPLLESAARAQYDLQQTMREAQQAADVAAQKALEEALESADLSAEERLAVREKAIKSVLDEYTESMANMQARAGAMQQETALAERLIRAQTLKARSEVDELRHRDELRTREAVIEDLRKEIETLRQRIRALESNQ